MVVDGENTDRGYMLFAAAIFRQAMYDALNTSKTAEARQHRQSAHEFFKSGLFRDLCSMLGLDPQYLTQKMGTRIKGGKA